MFKGHSPAHLTSTRRAFLESGLAITAAAVAPKISQAAPRIILDDASQLDATPVISHVIIRPDAERATIQRLRTELRAAATAGRPVAMGVARHSMGGQSLAQNGTAFTFETPVCIPSASTETYHVQAGSRWRDVIKALDPIGFSPAVMQAYNDFGVASAFSVNAHGWPVPHGPFGTTVYSIKLMLADGTIVTCSRTENADLFWHVMGGYGLFGIIIDLDVKMVPNFSLLPRFELLDTSSFAQFFVATCNDPAVNMAYGRLDISREKFLENALLISYKPTPMAPTTLSPGYYGGPISALTRDIYRAEVNSDLAKRFRWFMETGVSPHLLASVVTRNTVLNAPVKSLAGHNPKRTDILHEYFLPPEKLADFLVACRERIPKSKQDLLNVTLRFVGADKQSVLAYAPAARIAAVMSFSQVKSAEAELDMRQMTRDLIDQALAVGGSFYLPYRLHARRDQVVSGYPAINEFITFKKHYDPGLLFRNALWEQWFA